MHKGKFITLEGGEGVGKTTNLDFIKGYLAEHGVCVIVTREPGGTHLAEKIRALLLAHDDERVTEQAELLLLFAARSQHIDTVILPALAAGTWVLCDRFTDATYAYQGGGRAMSQAAIGWLENFVQAGLKPDLTLLLDAPVETGLCRARQRGKPDRFESEALDFFERVRRSYLVQAELYPERVKLIKADRSLVDVRHDIIELLHPLLAHDRHR
ncbi:MAG: dTMP kinase [Gammaproteobacteria bacterium HGW-Gammaproteobacteria-3]|jgi:dTMP kinase|nr:MAG: dTMP kinase [Gammaproteobacteria bacterium HGW-Gammaproteobacteria-3]